MDVAALTDVHVHASGSVRPLILEANAVGLFGLGAEE